MTNVAEVSSTRPYLIRAIYEWCNDNYMTPYVAVSVDGSVQVPREFVRDNEIVLNVSLDATSALKLGNDFIEFSARFAGTPREIMVPIGRVMAIYAKENGQGMSFPLAIIKPDPVVGLQVEDSISGAMESQTKVFESKPVILTSVKSHVRDNDVSDKSSGPPPSKSGSKLKRIK